MGAEGGGWMTHGGGGTRGGGPWKGAGTRAPPWVWEGGMTESVAVRAVFCRRACGGCGVIPHVTTWDRRGVVRGRVDSDTAG